MKRQEFPASVSTKARHLIPSMLTITEGYAQALIFVVTWTFSFLSHMEVWCFELQTKHNLLLRQSKTLCFAPVQLKQSFFFESISLRSSTPLTDLPC